MSDKKIGPFDFVKTITTTGENIYADNESGYNQYIINQALSFNIDCIIYVNEIQQYNLDDKTHYLFCLNTIDKKKRYGGWTKKDNLPADIDLIKEVYGYSTKDALNVLDLLSDKQLLELKDNYRKGGRK